MTRTKVVAAKREDGVWNITTQSADKTTGTILARVLINVAGPWVDQTLANAIHLDDGKRIRLVKGSHIVVKSLFDHDKCYIFQNADNRIVFAIPFEEEFTLIGTTDEDFQGGDPAKVSISENETTYLCDAASEYFENPVKPSDIVWAYSAVRPLMDDGASKAQEATREYVLTTDTKRTAAPLINVYGGKLTTYRKLAESVLDKVGEVFVRRGDEWTANAPLPGGDFPVTGFSDEVKKLQSKYGFLDPRHARRLIRLYGTIAERILGDATSTNDLGQKFGDDLYEVEVVHLIENEWAMTCEDILWRRTKQGLHFGDNEVVKLQSYLDAQTLDSANTPGTSGQVAP